jgi:hypothetical protein
VFPLNVAVGLGLGLADQMHGRYAISNDDMRYVLATARRPGTAGTRHGGSSAGQ